MYEGAGIEVDVNAEQVAPITRAPMVFEIQKAIARHYGLELSDIKGARKQRPVAYPRLMGYYLSRELTDASYPALGRYFNRDHSSIVVGVRRYKSIRETEVGLAQGEAHVRAIIAEMVSQPLYVGEDQTGGDKLEASPPWPVYDETVLRKVWGYHPDAIISGLLGHRYTLSAIRNKAWRMGLTRELVS